MKSLKYIFIFILISCFIYFCGANILATIKNNLLLIYELTEKEITPSERIQYLSKHKDVVRIAIFGDAEEFASKGINLNEIYALAEREINKSNGILGRKLELVWYNKNDINYKHQKVAEKILKDPSIYAVVGPFDSDKALCYSSFFATAGILHISPSANSNDLLEQKYPLSFSTTPADTDEAICFADHLTSNKINDLLIISEANNKYCESFAGEIDRVFCQKGLNVIQRVRFSENVNLYWFKEIIDSYKKLYDIKNVVIISDYFNDNSPQKAIINTIASTFCDGKLFFSECISADRYGLLNLSLSNCYSIAIFPDDNGVCPALRLLCQKDWFKKDFFTVRLYKSLWILKEAIDKSGSFEYGKIANYMENNEFNTPLGKFKFKNNHFEASPKISTMSFAEQKAMWEKYKTDY